MNHHITFKQSQRITEQQRLGTAVHAALLEPGYKNSAYRRGRTDGWLESAVLISALVIGWLAARAWLS